MPSQTIETVLAFKDQFTKKYAKAMGKADKSTKTFSDSLKKTNKRIVGIKSALTGIAGVAVLGSLSKAFFSVGQEAEGLTLQFETLLGSTEAATERMKELSQFAASTPFQLGEIAKASKVLQTLGGTSLATKDGLRLVGDAAAISGERIQDLAIHVGRAYSGLKANRPIGESAARLQELGLVSGETRNEVERLQQAARGSEAWDVLKKALEKNSGAMSKLSNTAGGMISTIKDQLQEGIRQMLNSGIWELFKVALSNIRDQMDKLIKGDFFKNLGLQMLDLAQWGNKAVVVLRVLWNVFQNGISVLTNFGQVLFDVVSLATSGFKGIALALTNDFQGAFDATNGKFEEFKNKFSNNLDDIKNAVISNDADMMNAVKEGSEIQLEIEKAKYDAINKLSDDTKNKIITNKNEETAKLFELDQKLENDLILLRAETKELAAVSNDEKLAAIESQRQAELEVLGRQLSEELRMAGENEKLKTQLAEKAALQGAKINKKSSDLEEALNKKKVDENVASLQILTGALSSFFGKSKELAIIDALVNTYVAANKALGQGGIFGIAAAAAVTAVGLKNVAKIQGFNNGGIVGGLGTRDSNTPTFLTAGEGVLTKDATNRIGSGGISSINDRNNQSQSITNNVTFSPTINASSKDGLKEMLDNSYVEFADFFNEQKEKGLV